MKLFQLILLCLFGLLQYQLWFGQKGISDYKMLRAEVTSHLDVNEKLIKRNKLLKADLEDLKTGLEGVEERARNELGLIRPGEVFFRITPHK